MADLLLIDLGSVWGPVWHSVAPSEPAGTPHDMTVARVRRMADGRPSHVAVCADWPGRYFRHDISELYKANRESKSEPAIAQLARVCDTLRRDGFPVWLANGFEADDIIATAVREARAAGLRVTVATTDKDLLALVSNGVSVRSVATGVEMGEPEVLAKFGVRPSQIPDWLALVGDAADNIPGVPGIGSKKATDLLKTWGHIAALMAAVEDPEDTRVDEKLRAKLLAAREGLLVSMRLVALRDDAPIDLSEALRERVAKPLAGSGNDREWDRLEGTVDEPKNDNEIHDAQVEDVPRGADSSQRAISPEHTPVLVDAMSAPTQAQSQAIMLVRPGSDEWSLALEPMSTPDAWKVAGHLFNSRVFGGFPNQAAMFAAVMLGRTLGVPAATIARSVHIVEGRMTLSAQFIVGLVLKSGKADFFKCIESSPTKATWKTHRKGDPDPDPTIITWTIDDAKAAGLVKPNGNYMKYPAVMLRWRAATDLARMVYADIIGGLYTPDELDSEHASVVAQAAA